MEFTPEIILILLVIAAFVAGFIDSIAGGGGLDHRPRTHPRRLAARHGAWHQQAAIPVRLRQRHLRLRLAGAMSI